MTYATGASVDTIAQMGFVVLTRIRHRRLPNSLTFRRRPIRCLVDGARTALREADAKLRTLSTALKQHQRQFKLVRSTLSSLQQLQGLDDA